MSSNGHHRDQRRRAVPARLRVGRIWEGTSEIQRLIVARARAARGGADPALVDRLLHPRSVAIVGASERPATYSSETLLNLRRLGYEGEVWRVDPRRSSVHGLPCFASLSDLPSPPDAVVVAIPAPGVPAVIEEAGAIGSGGAVVFAAGFGESPAGARLEQALREAARRYSLASPSTCATRPASATRSGGLGLSAVA